MAKGTVCHLQLWDMALGLLLGADLGSLLALVLGRQLALVSVQRLDAPLDMGSVETSG